MVIVSLSQDATLQQTDKIKLAAYQAVIKGIVNKHVKSSTYLTCGQGRKLMHELFNTTVEIERVIGLRCYSLALSMAIEAYNEGIRALQYADDSCGDVGDYLYALTKLMEDIVTVPIQHDESVLKDILKLLLKKAKAANLKGWPDFQLDFVRLGMPLCEGQVNRKLWIKEVKKLIESYEEQSCEFTVGELAALLFQVVSVYGSEEEKNQLIEAYLSYDKVRRLVVEEKLAARDYERALTLTLEGEAKSNDDWKKVRYTIYEQMNDKESQKTLAKELFIKGHFEFYETFKQLEGEHFLISYKEIKEALKQDKFFYETHPYLQLIEAEQDVEAMFELVQEQSYWIERYATTLYINNPVEVEKIYTEYIITLAKEASNRGKYKAICYKLRHFKKLFGSTTQQALINELIKKYENRPAFIEELSCL